MLVQLDNDVTQVSLVMRIFEKSFTQGKLKSEIGILRFIIS